MDVLISYATCYETKSSMADLLEFKYEGFLALRKGDMVKITWAFSGEHELHPRGITRIINETAQVENRSSRETAASSPLEEPIIGKVASSAVDGSSTSFVIEPSS